MNWIKLYCIGSILFILNNTIINGTTLSTLPLIPTSTCSIDMLSYQLKQYKCTEIAPMDCLKRNEASKDQNKLVLRNNNKKKAIEIVKKQSYDCEIFNVDKLSEFFSTIKYPKSRLYPIFLFHGLTDSASGMESLKQNILNMTPGKQRIIHLMDVFTKVFSAMPLWKQVRAYIHVIREIISIDPIPYQNGYHFIAHSQGALIARAIIQTMDDHRVHTFISLAGPQNGIYYGSDHDIILQTFLSALPERAYDAIMVKFKDGTIQDAVTSVAYQPWAQKLTSLANIWRPVPPVHGTSNDIFLQNNFFFPILNNLYSPIVVANSKLNQDLDYTQDEDLNSLFSTQYKRKMNFIRVHKVIALYSDADKIISPCISGGFGYYKEDQIHTAGKWDVLKMEETEEYIHDTYGLRYLHERKRLIVKQVSNVPHSCWIKNAEICDHNSLFSAYIKQYII